MIIDVKDINVKGEVLIDSGFEFDSELISSIGARGVKNIKFVGKVYYTITDEITIDGRVTGTLILEDSVDLSDYYLKIDTKIVEIIENFENTLDINEILWNNIVLEVPIRVTDKELGDISGNGWKVKSDDDEELNDSPFEALKQLFEGGE